ncbi:MAG: phenylalanine--tRNA ligase subunit beta [Clostridiales bacterium]|nr:phenylalanine--tRNA ligase subunit beta [Clostridiales bacterium]
MRLSRKWLSEYTTIAASSKEYAERMTMTGSKVELIEEPSESIKNVVVGRVVAMERHPNSDHLWICQVDVAKEEPVQIVTGAQNVNVGDLVPVALHKSLLPGGVKIEKGKLRGVVSNGMLCSLSELGLDTHDFPYAIEDGIFILQEDCKPGDDIRPIIGADDTIVEFEITNNRPDCLSMIGLARESAATFGTELRLPDLTPVKGTGDIREHLTVEVENPELCPRYTARMIKNIKIGPSPKWLRQRLRAAGVRPINNIVDITNYVMLEYGQPMHAFDYACLEGGKIVVRTAREGETINTLDGTPRALTPDMLVIADAVKPVGVAGVMGGENSEITENTKYAVFESANFNGVSIRKTAIALGMRTDASSRFEKGLDPENTVRALERACQLVEELGAGEVIGGIIDIAAPTPPPRRLPLNADKIRALLGADIPEEFMVKTLKKLGFKVEGGVVEVPSWRGDVEHYSDLAEEVARFWGYDKIEPTLFADKTGMGGLTEEQSLKRRADALCRAIGYSEIYTYSFTSPSDADKIRLPEDSPLRRYVTILNPLGEDTSVMRTTSLPSMLQALSVNFSRRNEDVRLYEFATVYRPCGETLPDERVILTLGAYGDIDFYGIKGAVEALLSGLRVKDVSFTAERENPSYHPGRCAVIRSGETILGVLGEVHPLVAKSYDLDRAYCAELDFSAIAASRGKEPRYVPLPKYPAVARDIAVVCDAKTPVGDLAACIKKAGGKYLRDLRLFDVYTGSQVPEGKKSVAFSLTLRADDMTLTDEHADETVKNILKALYDAFGATIR